MNGNGWPGLTASGVSTGKISRSNRFFSSSSSSSLQSSTWATVIPSVASAGTSRLRQRRDWFITSSSTRGRIAASASRGVIPSAERTERPDSAWSSSPATLTMKNSSSIEEKIAQNFTRSRSGTDSSSASSSTRSS